MERKKGGVHSGWHNAEGAFVRQVNTKLNAFEGVTLIFGQMDEAYPGKEKGRGGETIMKRFKEERKMNLNRKQTFHHNCLHQTILCKQSQHTL